MTERDPNDQGPLAPRRPLTGPAGASTGSVAERQAHAQQTTMAIPVVTDASPPPQGRQARGPRPPAVPIPGYGPAGAVSGSTDTDSRAQTPEPRNDSAQPKEKPARRGRAPVRTRKARLKLTRIDPWSVMKLAFALSIALAIVTVVAVAIVWSVLDAAGVWESINTSVGTVLSEDNETQFDVTDYVGTSRVLGLTTIVAAANVVLLTAIATLAAFLYNLAASLLGGLEITLAEDQS
jgi:hypothetical protein